MWRKEVIIYCGWSVGYLGGGFFWFGGIYYLGKNNINNFLFLVIVIVLGDNGVVDDMCEIYFVLKDY